MVLSITLSSHMDPISPDTHTHTGASRDKVMVRNQYADQVNSGLLGASHRPGTTRLAGAVGKQFASENRLLHEPTTGHTVGCYSARCGSICLLV